MDHNREPEGERRLRVEDPNRVTLLAVRFGEVPCIALGEGAWATGDSATSPSNWDRGEGMAELRRAGGQA